MNATPNHAQMMDRIYRFQRYIYDITRKYYLLGRDRLIREMRIEPGDRILEIGCGTARNLILMAHDHPQAHFYGLDASHEMLITAETKVKRAGLHDRITLRHCLAEECDAKKTFGLDTPFDGIFFSYSLSMIPSWRNALQIAFQQLQPDGELAMVDFCDQLELPRWFRAMLTKWLSWFHVRHEPELLRFLPILATRTQAHLTIQYLYGRYAFRATLIKNQTDSEIEGEYRQTRDQRQEKDRDQEDTEGEGFEPSKPLQGLHDFQSCSFSQLGHPSSRVQR